MPKKELNLSELDDVVGGISPIKRDPKMINVGNGGTVGKADVTGGTTYCPTCKAIVTPVYNATLKRYECPKCHKVLVSENDIK